MLVTDSTGFVNQYIVVNDPGCPDCRSVTGRIRFVVRIFGPYFFLLKSVVLIFWPDFFGSVRDTENQVVRSGKSVLISTDQYRYWFWVRFAHPWVNEMTGVYENITVIFRRTLFRIIRLKFWKKNVQFLTKIVRTPFENDPKMTNSGHKLLKWPF